MSIKYYKLFDLLNRRNMKKSDLLEIISSKTIAKLSKGANLNTDVIDKICLHLHCQPNDIMEVIEEGYCDSDIVYTKECITEIIQDENDVTHDLTTKEIIFRDKETDEITNNDVIEENKAY